MKGILLFLFLISGCAWDSDSGWSVAESEQPVSTQEDTGFKCIGENEFGRYMKGGGCNAFGCWIEGGNCNSFGCSVDGNCTAKSCPKKTSSIKCEE